MSLASRTATVLTLALSSLLTISCTKSPTHAFDPAAPIVTQVKTQVVSGPSAASLHLSALKAKHAGKALSTQAFAATELDPQPGASASAPGAAPAAQAGSAMSGEVTLTKKEILNREFLFGADLQYSSISDESEGMFQQSTSSGHVIAKFQILGDRLQVLSDESSNYDSDINHPGKLIQQYPILRQDANTVTITVREASFAAVDMAGVSDSPVRNTWVRTIEYVPKGNYLLVETSVQFNNGKVVEFMESLFPRDTLVKPDSKPLFNDADREPNAARYRFLDNGPVWLNLPEGRVKTQVAERFPIDPTHPIEWYVTPNIPAEYIPVLKMAVEGWNRYSQKMWKRDLLKFVGVMPAGVKLGDPRYNIINWDSVPDAGAAYESQAVDPLTGLASHSMIYLPYAWIKIGNEYWTDNALTHSLDPDTTATDSLKKLTFMGRPLEIACEFDMAFVAPYDAKVSPTTFSYELTKQTLFHEVGHSLGFAHNFKGSLSFDPTKAESMFSTSIMDYNQYDIENAAFENVNSSNGPLLEYDRQVLSVLYNNSADVASSDPVLPACNDDEADDVSAGVDPFCLRYDAGHDPSIELASTVKLIHDGTATLGHIQSLPTAIAAAASALPAAVSVNDEKTATDAVTTYVNQLKGAINFYLSSGAQSLGSMTKMQIKALYTYKNDDVPEDAKAADVRQRVAAAVTEIVNTEAMDPIVNASLKKAAADAQLWLAQTAWSKSMGADSANTKASGLVKPLDDLQARIETIALPHLRGALLGALKRVPTSPFAYTSGDKDYEQVAIQLLHNALTQPLTSGQMRPASERVLAVPALLTFADTDSGAAAIADSQKHVQTELQNVQNATDREALRNLLKAFTPAPASK